MWDWGIKSQTHHIAGAKGAQDHDPVLPRISKAVAQICAPSLQDTLEPRAKDSNAPQRLGMAADWGFQPQGYIIQELQCIPEAGKGSQSRSERLPRALKAGSSDQLTVGHTCNLRHKGIQAQSYYTYSV